MWDRLWDEKTRYSHFVAETSLVRQTPPPSTIVRSVQRVLIHLCLPQARFTPLPCSNDVLPIPHCSGGIYPIVWDRMWDRKCYGQAD